MRLCELELALHRKVACPEARCALWDDVDEECVFSGSGIDFASKPRLAAALLEMRRRAEVEPPARVDTHALLPPGLR